MFYFVMSTVLMLTSYDCAILRGSDTNIVATGHGSADCRPEEMVGPNGEDQVGPTLAHPS